MFIENKIYFFQAFELIKKGIEITISQEKENIRKENMQRDGSLK